MLAYIETRHFGDYIVDTRDVMHELSLRMGALPCLALVSQEVVGNCPIIRTIIHVLAGSRCCPALSLQYMPSI